MTTAPEDPNRPRDPAAEEKSATPAGKDRKGRQDRSGQEQAQQAQDEQSRIQPPTNAPQVEAADRTPGDGTLVGATPAGLTVRELRERAEAPDDPNDTGTG